MMRWAAMVIILAGCATDFQADRYEPICARECLARHKVGCGVYQAHCNDVTKQCLSTCPIR